jgi:hypothetical protein
MARWRDGAMARWRDGAMARWRDGLCLVVLAYARERALKLVPLGEFKEHVVEVPGDLDDVSSWRGQGTAVAYSHASHTGRSDSSE